MREQEGTETVCSKLKFKSLLRQGAQRRLSNAGVVPEDIEFRFLRHERFGRFFDRLQVIKIENNIVYLTITLTDGCLDILDSLFCLLVCSPGDIYGAASGVKDFGELEADA